MHTRDAVETFLKHEHPQGQRIALPYGLFTAGEDRSDILEFALPPEVRGRSVLDAAGDLGFFCLEAWRRGAARATGGQNDLEQLRQARTIADMLGAPVEYRLFDIEDGAEIDPSDWVLFLNRLHLVRDPVAVLDRLTRLTRERLVLEVAGPSSKRSAHLLRRMGAGWMTRRRLERLPIVVVGRYGSTGRKLEQKHFFTPSALEHLLLYQRAAFSHCEVFRVPRFRDRFLLVAHKRRIGRLLMVAGPSACGKSTLIDRMLRGQAQELAAACDLGEARTWQESDSLRIHNDGHERVERLLFHLDLFRPLRRHAPVRRRVELDLLDCADRAQVATVFARPSVLRDRVERRIANLRPGQTHMRAKLEEILRFYERPEPLARLLDEWAECCASRGIEPIYVDNSDERPRLLAADEWRGAISERGA